VLPKCSINESLIVEVRRAARTQKLKAALRQFEAAEPNLAEFVMEESAAIFASLQRIHVSSGCARKVHRRSLRLTLVCIEILRRAC